MEAAFWHERWQRQETAFHLDRVNPMLERHVDALGLMAGDSVFVPLCGASLDLPWLVEKGFNVIGVELSELAVAQLFNEHGLKPSLETLGDIKRWQAGALTIFQGDLFSLTSDMTGPVTAVYDRAALIALPPDMRHRYVQHTNSITPMTRRTLLITLEYDPTVMNGPPFSVVEEDVHSYFAEDFSVTRLSNDDIVDRVPRFREKGHQWLREPVYLIQSEQT